MKVFSEALVEEARVASRVADLSQATIGEVLLVAQYLEKKTGIPFIRMDQGSPGLPPNRYGVEAEKEALERGVGSQYPPADGVPELKKAASRFIKAFIDVDIDPLGCIPTTGSVAGSFGSFIACTQRIPGKDKVLFIDPGFPIQKSQLRVLGISWKEFDIYPYRGEGLRAKLEEELAAGDIAAIVYSNPNNPAWICLEESELKVIGELATKYDVIVMEDLAYFCMDYRRELGHPFQPPFVPTVARYTDNYILAVSGSKAFSYAGQRIGVLCISNALYHRTYPALRSFGVDEFGNFICNRLMYTLSSGTTHSVQHAMAALMEAACNGSYNFLDDVREYGRRAKFMKDVLLANGFYLVYDNDLGAPLADGFYFTVQYPGMNDLQLTRELMYYGIAVFPLDTMGSNEQGVRICTSFFSKEQEPLFEERIRQFHMDRQRS